MSSTSAPKLKPTLHQLDTDEDLDELDDVLSEFTQKPSTSISSTSTSQPAPPFSPLTSPPPPPPTATTTTTFNRPRTNTRVDQAPKSIPSLSGRTFEKTVEDEVDEGVLEDEFTRELVKNMEELMRELTKADEGKGGEGDGGEGGEGKGKGEMSKEEREEEAERLMKAAWEAMLIEGMDGAIRSEGGDTGKSEETKGGKDDFQAKIRQTMDKLKQSESNLQAGSASGANPNPESLESLLATLKDLGLDDLGGAGGENGEEEAELADFLENMMGHLMSKEVLYDPLKELDEKFPAYLSNPPASLQPADKKRYEKQYEYIKKILTVFDDPNYDEKDAKVGKKVTDLMSEMREYGSPPEEIMGPMPPGFGPDGGCVVS